MHKSNGISDFLFDGNSNMLALSGTVIRGMTAANSVMVRLRMQVRYAKRSYLGINRPETHHINYIVISPPIIPISDWLKRGKYIQSTSV